MGRFAKQISKDELSQVLADKKNLYTIPYKDFNLEIHIQEDAEININPVEEQNDIVYSLISVKGIYDSLPIYFIAYIDELNRLRAFLPKYGNTYNPWTGTHFGSERAWRIKARSITNMPEQYYEENKEQGGYQPTQLYKDEFLNMRADTNKMINEFLQFIHIK